MYPPQPPQQPYPQPDPNQQPGYAPSPYAPQQPYAPPPDGQQAYGMPPNPYAPPSTPMQPPYTVPPSVPLQQPNPYANPYAPQQPSVPLQQPNPYAPPSVPMYGAPAPMAAPNALNFNAFTLPQNRGNLTAAIGGVVALISFFVLPYYGISAGSLGSQSYSASDMTNGTYGGSGALWLIPLLAIVAIAVACIVTFGIRSIQGLTPRNAAYAILGSGGLSALIFLYTLYAVNSKISQATNGLNLSSVGVSYGFSLGFWLTLLAMIAVTVGGIMNLRQVQAQPPMMPPYMGGGVPPQMPPMQ